MGGWSNNGIHEEDESALRQGRREVRGANGSGSKRQLAARREAPDSEGADGSRE